MKSPVLLAIFAASVLCLDDADDSEFHIEPPFVSAQPVVAAERLVVTSGESSTSLWSQVLPFDIQLKETSSIFDSKKRTRHITSMQTLDGMPVWNARGNLNIQHDGSLLASYQRFIQKPISPPTLLSENTLSTALDAVRRAVSNHDLQDDKSEHVLVRDEDGRLRHAWHFYAMEGGPVTAPNLNLEDGVLVDGELIQIDLPGGALYEHYWDALVDIDTLEVIGLTDLVHKARATYRYNVFATPDNDPSQGTQGLYNEQFDETYSPIGWQDLGDLYGGYVAPYTMGNNIFAMTSDYSSFAFASNEKFDFPFDQGKEPEAQLSFCLTQLFYTNNRLHDIFYAHGFDEESGNFQLNNFGRGGHELDPIYTLCHAVGQNNAQMLTLPDGSPGIMSMFMWHFTTPKRDSSLDAGVVTHEYAHGVSNRLTGGPSTLCLSTKQSGGLGEGWGDFFGFAFHVKQGDHRDMKFVLASYLVNYANGIRRYPYTSDMGANPTDWSYYVLYKSSKHQLGEIWAVTLFECYWNLVEEFGWSEDIIGGDKGNNLMISLTVEAMKYQPCEPTFIQARDAIFAALYDRNDPRRDKAAAALWAAFAKRGLGEHAKEGGVADYGIPRNPAALVPQSPSNLHGGNIIPGQDNKMVVNAVIVTLGVTVMVMLLVACCLVYRNYRLRKALTDASVPTAHTPLRSAMDSAYRHA